MDTSVHTLITISKLQVSFPVYISNQPNMNHYTLRCVEHQKTAFYLSPTWI